MRKAKSKRLTLKDLHISQQKTGVLLERLEHNFAMFIEAFAGLTKRVGDLEIKIESLERRMDSLETKIDVQFDAVFEKFDTFTAALARKADKLGV